MPDLEISNLTVLPEGSVAATDPLPIVDVSASETKKVTVKALIEAGAALIDDASIPGAKVGTLGTNQVATAAIQNLAITTAKIADGAVTAVKITDATITGAKLVNNTITATQIAANAIGASELADNAVDTAAIASNAITNVKINNGEIVYAKLNISDGDIPGAKITGNSITSAQIGVNAVGSSELADNSVDTAAIVNAAVTGAKIATDTIGSGNIAANAVGASELANNAVDTAAIVSNAVTTAKIADDQVTTAKLADNLPGTILATGAIGSTQIAANAITDSELANNAVDAGAIASNAVTEAKIAANAVTTTKIADGTITPAKLNTSNLDRSINVASGNLGINNAITAATRSGITYNAQGLITGTVALAASDLPLATTSAVGGVSVGAGLTVTGAGALSLSNSVTGATVSGITFNNQGQITAATGLVSANLPTATTSAKGAVAITSGGGLTVDGSGGLTTSTSGISTGTFTKLTVNNKGVATAGTTLSASDIPSLDATKITTGSIAAARIGNDSIDGSKLSNTSTAIFQSIAQSGYPTAQFSGQILFDTVSEDAFIWDGNAWQAITTLTKGSLVFGGTFNASTSKMASTTTAGIAAGLAVGSNLPTPSATTDGLYVVVDVAGTPSAPAPVVSLSPPDYILGVTNSGGSSWNEIDLSQTVAGQVASNITFTPYGQLSSTNVQDALQELETEKMGLAGGTCTGQLLISNTGSIVFEGSTIDAYELTLAVADPTLSDKTITFPDVTGTLITTGDTNTVTSTMVDGSLVNANLAANAAIAFSKLAALNSAQILVGNGSNVPTAVAVTGDIGINNAGLTSITAGAIVNADISNSAAITGSKVTTGTTSAVGVLQLTDSAASTSTSTAATPAAVKVAKDAADAAATTANAALPKAGGTMTDHLIIDNGKELRLSESDGDGSNYTGLKAQAQSGDITLTLPAVAPTANQVLKADASTPTTLTWAADSATDATKMPLAGGTFTGDVTFTGDSSNGLWDKSASAFVANLTGNVTGNVSGSAATVTGAAQSAITSLGTLTGLTSSGDINLNAQADLRFKDSDSSHYVALQSPGTIASSFTLTLPATDAAVSGYVLASDGSGTLSWVDPGSSSSPTFTGDATLTNDGALVGFSNLNATYTGNTKTLTVTVASKTGSHRYNGSGSGSGYKINGKESPFLTLTPGRTYKFDQADSSNSGHPLRFYLEADKTTAYTTGVTTSGTAGSSGAYTQIVVSDTTPQVLHYQCSAHSLMGNSVQTNSNQADLSTLNASNLSSGTVNVARLGSGASSSKFLRGDNTWQTISATPEGTAILSTGESGGTKFLREDGDGTCSWQAVPAAAAGSLTGSTLASGVTASSLTSVGTLTGLDIGSSSGGMLNLNNTSGGDVYMAWKRSGTRVGYVGFGSPSNNHIYLRNEINNGSIYLQTRASGTNTTVLTLDSSLNATFAGTVTATTFSGSGASLTSLNAANLGSGTVPTARLGSGTASQFTVLKGNNTWGEAISNDSNANVSFAGANSNDLDSSGGYPGYNFFAGYEAGNAVTHSDGVNSCIAIGYRSLKSMNGNSCCNVAIGYETLTTGTGSLEFNVAIGRNAGRYSTSAQRNTIIGDAAGEYITTGDYNTAIGSIALYGTGGSSAPLTGSRNIGIGYYAGAAITSGSDNIVLGSYNSAYQLTTGSKNIILGRQVAYSLTTGSNNTYIGGENTAFNATTGSNNTCLGHNARPSSATISNEITLGDTNITKFRIPGIDFVLKDNGGTPSSGQVLTADGSGEGYWADGGITSDGQSNTIGGTNAGQNLDSDTYYNTLFGYQAGKSINSGDKNTCIGYNAGQSINSGEYHTLVGYECGQAATTGYDNVFMGGFAGRYYTTASGNVGIGSYAGNSITTGGANTMLGAYAGFAATTGTDNTCLGYGAGRDVTGSDNTFVGNNAGNSGTNDITSGSNNILIGNTAAATSATVSNEVTIGNTSITKFRVPGIGLDMASTDVNSGGRPAIPLNSQAYDYTLVASDAGKTVYLNASTVTIPASVFDAGDAVTIINPRTVDIAITKSIGYLWFAGDGTNASRTLAPKGIATIYFTSSNVGFISGAGLS